MTLAASGVPAAPSPAGARRRRQRRCRPAPGPLTNGQPDQGFEGNRFTGIPLFDSLTMWDLSSADRPSVVIPGLATEWRVDPNDRTRWIFTLRRGVRFHDGSEFNADAVVWNVRKVLDREAPHFDARQVGVTATRMPTLRRAEKIDDFTVALFTSEPDSLLPINLTNLFMASPAQWDRHRAASPNAEAAWGAFAREPSGTGPFRVSRFVPRERLEMVRFDGYWGEKACPHRRAAVEPGGLDRGALARCHPAAARARHGDHAECAAACLAVAALLRRGLALP